MVDPRDKLQIRVAGGEALLDFPFKGRLGAGRGQVKLNVKDILIDGITIPQFSWGWTGLTLASGILSGVGSLIISLLSDALFSSQRKSIEEYLQELLQQFQELVRQELQINDLRNYVASEKAYTELFRLYSDSHRMSTLEYLVHQTPVTFYQLESLGFYGYRPFMILAGLRLAIIQEYIKRTGKGQAHFGEVRQAAIAHHQKVQEQIIIATNPNTIAGSVHEFWRTLSSGVPDAPGDIAKYAPVKRRILSENLDGLIVFFHNKVYREDADPELTREQIQFLVNLPIHKGPMAGPEPAQQHQELLEAQRKAVFVRDIRAKLKADSVDLGEKMVARWANPEEIEKAA